MAYTKELQLASVSSNVLERIWSTYQIDENEF